MIGHVLKYLRKKKGLKQEEIAKILNIKSNALSQYETSARQPTFDTIEKIADLCDFDIIFRDRKTNENFKAIDILRKEI